MIKIIAVGQLKEQYLKDLCNDYLKRINKYHKIMLVEVKDENLLKEKESILKKLSNNEYIIALDIMGTKLDSFELAKRIDNLFFEKSNITFIIGGSDGLHDDIKKMAHFRISFSDLTFPHGLFRGIVLEQIYRSFKINNNEKYHK